VTIVLAFATDSFLWLLLWLGVLDGTKTYLWFLRWYEFFRYEVACVFVGVR